MKYIITILLLVIGTFAQNTTFKDGTDCKCDSIHSEYYESGILMRELASSGTWVMKSYYESGQLKKEILRNPFIYAIYYENGTINVIGNEYEKIQFHYDLVYAYEIKTNRNKHYVLFDSYGRIGVYIPSNGDAYWFGYEDTDTILTAPTGRPISSTNHEKNYHIIGTATYKNNKLIGYKKCTDGRVGNESLNCLN